jgi:spore coat protein U-like protein
MKKIIVATAVAAALAAGNTQAGQTLGTFNVNVTLTSACTLTAVNDLAFAYTSLQAGAAAATGGGFSVSCTTSLPYTFALQLGTPAGPFVAPFNTTLGPITDSVVNLDYSLGLSAAGGAGSGVAQPYSVTGTMAGNQTGTCALASCTNAGAANRTHTLIVNY